MMSMACLLLIFCVSGWINNAEELIHDISMHHLFQYCDTNPLDRLEIWTKVRSLLEDSGEYEVGRTGFFGTARNKIVGSNPTTSFGTIAFLTPWKQGPWGWSEYLTKYNFSNVWTGANGLMSNASFFLGRQDAMVWMGCTPPAVRYYHMRTFSGVHQWGDYDPHVPMAGLGDTVNQANINTTGGPHGSDPWSRTTVIISTADAGTLEEITSVFEQAGIPRTAINTDVLPSSDWIRFLDDAPDSARKSSLLGTARAEDLWPESKADGIIMLGRVTGYLNETDGEKYSGTVSRAMIFHKKPGNDHIPIAAVPGDVNRLKGTGEYESWLGEKLLTMRKSLISKMKSKGFSLLGSILHEKDIRDDYRCIHWQEYSVFYGGYGGFCDAQPQDVSYSWTPFVYTWMEASLHPEEYTNPPDKLRRAMKFMWNDTFSERVFVDIGVNHEKVKNIGYNSIMITTMGPGFELPANSSYWYGDEMEGSAAKLGEWLDDLFVVATSRSATCESLKDVITHCSGMESDVMASSAPVLAVERLYLELDTATGPFIDELLQAEFLVFDRPIGKRAN